MAMRHMLRRKSSSGHAPSVTSPKLWEKLCIVPPSTNWSLYRSGSPATRRLVEQISCPERPSRFEPPLQSEVISQSNFKEQFTAPPVLPRKGTDPCFHSPYHLTAVAAEINRRPREILSWQSSAEQLARLSSPTDRTIYRCSDH